MSPKPLPTDVQELQAIIASQQVRIDQLLTQLAALRRQRFGRSSEKLDRQIKQLELMLEELDASVPEHAPDPVSSPEAGDKENAKPFRKPLPEHLPREEIVLSPEPTCPSCGEERHGELGEDVTEVLEFVPAHFKVIRYVRPKWSCRCCETIRQAPVPSLPIQRGRPGPALLSHLFVSKFCDHLPFYRQGHICARLRVDLSRSTMASWLGQTYTLLRPLFEALRINVMGSAKLHTDDTPVPVLKPGNKKTKTGRLWVYVRDNRPYGSTDPPAAFYHYSPDRKGEHPKTHLKDFTGILQADGFPGYDALYKPGQENQPRILEAACMAHARRKFHDVHVANGSPIAEEALRRIGELYDIEREIRGQSAQYRQAVRQQRAQPLLDDLEKWFHRQKAKLPGKSSLAKAIRYALSRWQALCFYINDGTVEIDNNAAERAIRGVTLGRKNYLFFGSDAGGERAAGFYYLLETAKLNGINPEEYLTDLLTKIADYPVNRAEELLPWNWAAATTQ